MFLQEQLEYLQGRAVADDPVPTRIDKKLQRAKEKAEKQMKKAEEAELKVATKLYEKDMEIYKLEQQKANILKC